jgi:hypothetical protein
MHHVPGFEARHLCTAALVGSLLLVVDAFERCGMLAREHAPDLLVEVEGRQYEVKLSFFALRD